MKKLKCCIAFNILFLATLIGQTDCKCAEADKLRPIIGRYFNSGKLDSAAAVLYKLNNPAYNLVCKIIYLDGIAQVNIAKKQFNTARQFFKQEEALQNKVACKKLMIRFYNSMARYYQEAGYRDSVIIVSLKALEAAEAEKDSYASARASANLAAIFEQEKQLEKSHYYNLSGLRFAKMSKDTTMLGALLSRTSASYFDQYNYTKKEFYLDSAYILAKECIEVSRNKPSNLIEIPEAYGLLSQYYITKKDYPAALVYADSILLVSPKNVFDFYRHILNGYQRKSEALVEIKKYAEARRMADSAYNYATLFNTQLTITPLKSIFQLSKELKDFERATWAHEKMTALKDSLFSIEKNAAINELEKKYNQTKNENTIIALTKQRQLYVLLIIIALLLTVFSIVYFRQKSAQQKKDNLLIEERLARARINPHFFFNILSALQNIALKIPGSNPLGLNISKFANIMREALESTYNDYITVEEEINFLKQYLDLQLIRFPDKFTYAIEASEEVLEEELLVPSMLVQPIIENSIEHGFANIDYVGHISIVYKKEYNQLQIEITDNGRGFLNEQNKKKAYSSRAMQIINDRINLINLKQRKGATIQVKNSSLHTGVEAVFNLPIMQKK